MVFTHLVVFDVAELFKRPCIEDVPIGNMGTQNRGLSSAHPNFNIVLVCEPGAELVYLGRRRISISVVVKSKTNLAGPCLCIAYHRTFSWAPNID